MMPPLTIDAPCKVNLTLDVFPRRPDGYHDLDSLVVAFAPCDTLTFTARKSGHRAIELTCSDSTLPTDEQNLAYRAAWEFMDEFLPTEPVTVAIALDKRLPHQAGLGGGSSDAATVLRALSRMFAGGHLSDDLVRVAARVGSDVPLFLFDGPVRMRGRGEIVEPAGVPLPPLFGVFVKPDCGVSTGDAYVLLDALPSRPKIAATPRLLDTLARGEPSLVAMGAAMHNDFEAVVLPAYPGVAEAHRAVREAGAIRALLCGSGSAIFGLARDRAHALAMASALTGRFPWVSVGESLGSPDTITSDVDR